MTLGSSLREALGHTLLASIGPMTSEELRQQGLSIDFEPSHPKLGFLVKSSPNAVKHCFRIRDASNQ